MAKICPITGERVLYQECLECNEKVCRKNYTGKEVTNMADKTKKRWKVPCVWQMMGYLTVEADTPEEAWKAAEKIADDCPLPDGAYLDDSFELDYEGEPMEF